MNTGNNPINDKRTIWSWAIFDWANSAFALVITTAVFPPYFLAMVDDQVEILGNTISDSTLLSWTISAAYIIIATQLPIWSGVADYANKRKFFLILFTLIGSLSCLGLYFFSNGSFVYAAVGLYMLGIIGFEGGKLFYDSFLPLIASKDRFDMVSAKGFSYGYIGSVILLLLNLAWIQMPDKFGFADAGEASRASFLSVGVWWFVFALIPFYYLPADSKKSMPLSYVTKGWNEIRSAGRLIASEKNTQRFLGSYFLYISGTITVIYLATTFATKELQFEQAELIITVLIIQIVAIGGAYLFGWIAKIQGSVRSLQIMLVIWTVICVLAYFVHTKPPFFFIAGLVGLVMGGIQATSRAAYSKLIGNHKNEISSLFSFFEVLEKIAIVFGTFLFGLMDQLTGDLRVSVLTLGVLFLISLGVIRRVQID